MNRTFCAALIALFAAGSAMASDFATEVMEATFRFYHPDSFSTCFLVKREAPDTANYLVTAAHTVERTHGETAVLVLREPKADGSFLRHEYTIAIRRGDKPLWVRDEDHDVAVLRLADPLPVAVTALSTSALANQEKLKVAGVHICSPLFILTYPQGFEANGAGFPVARHSIFASPPLLPVLNHPTFMADFMTFPGDSGSPVFFEGKDGHPLVAGIVVEENFHEDRRRTDDYEERVIRRPLGMGTILHAQYVRETVEAAAAQAEMKPK